MTTNKEASTLDDKIIAHLRKTGGSTAWAMRAHVDEYDRSKISRSLQRLKRKGLVQTNSKLAYFWEPVRMSAAIAEDKP